MGTRVGVLPPREQGACRPRGRPVTRRELLDALYDRLRENYIDRQRCRLHDNIHRHLLCEHRELLREIKAHERGGMRTPQAVRAMLAAREARNACRQQFLDAGLPIPDHLLTPALRRRRDQEECSANSGC